MKSYRRASDKDKADHMRFELGCAGWLVSWVERDDGTWLAKVSCSRHEETIHAVGKTRTAAIKSASLKLAEIIKAESMDQDADQDQPDLDDPADDAESWKFGR